MPHASAYPLCKAAIVTRLQTRTPELSGVHIDYQSPQKASDIASTGSWEAIHLNDAEGIFEDRILCAGALTFDETFNLTLVIQVLRGTSLGTQQAADERVSELLYEVHAELSDQQNWDLTALDLDQFDYFQVTPGSHRWVTGFLPRGEGHGARIELALTARARRSFP